MKRFLLILSIFLFHAGCKKDYSIVPNIPDKLIITILDQYENPPSRVSVFFKVESREGQPIAGLTEQDFTIYEKGRNDEKKRLLSEDETTRVLSDNRQVFKNNIILLLDLSASVTNNSLPELKAAASSFIKNAMASSLNSSNQIGIWFFDGRDAIHSLIDFTDNQQALLSAIESIRSSLATDSSTDLFGAVLKSTKLAESKITESTLQGILASASIIIFTDGTDQAARYGKEEAYDAVNNASGEINFYTIGLGNEIDEKVLKNIGKTSSVYANNTTNLTEKFAEIAKIISDRANSFYLFEYCTPKRDGSGINELHIHVERDGQKGSAMTTFNADGFSDDCDLN